ncbi:SixA phosphatase family protein [Kitasatospora sp. NPDC004240]
MSAEQTRRIVFLRHAKSSRPEGVEDHERPLAERGRGDAPRAGRWLADSGVGLDLVLCSTALRCRETWELASAELPVPPRTVFEGRVYDASAGELIALLREVPEEVSALVLVGHNPSMQELAAALPGEGEGDLLARLDDSGFPTAAIADLTFTGPWRDLGPGSARLTALWGPRL